MESLRKLLLKANPESIKNVKNVFVSECYGSSRFGTLVLEDSDTVEVSISFTDHIAYFLSHVSERQLGMIVRFVELCRRKGMVPYFLAEKELGKTENDLAREWSMILTLMRIVRQSAPRY